MEGWAPVKKIAKYVGMSERTIRDWLKRDGLKHARLKTGTILIKFSDVDEHLNTFQVKDSDAEKIEHIANETLKDFGLR